MSDDYVQMESNLKAMIAKRDQRIKEIITEFNAFGVNIWLIIYFALAKSTEHF
jgi:hypothetical protein